MDSKINYLFGENSEQWNYGHSYLHYVTPWQIGEKVVDLADQHYDLAEHNLWDMFAGIGTDTVKFATYCKKITCTEIDPGTYENLTKNLSAFKVENTETYNLDCLELLEKVSKDDIIYFDPPWGDKFESGKEFDFKSIRLPNGISIVELLHRLHEKHDKIIIKSPYDCTTFEMELDKHITKVYGFPKPKLKYIFLNN